MHKINLVGQRFGRWTVLEQRSVQSPHDHQARTMATCICECGTVSIVDAANLRYGLSKSCGCYRRERPITTGLSGHPFYKIWRGMISRCDNLEHPAYRLYGALGVYVCERWKNDLLAFAGDIGPRPGPEYSVDRIDPDGPYSPDNCRWANPTTQQNNRRTTVYVTIGEETHRVPEWLQIFHISRSTYTGRRQRGMSARDALATPIRFHK
jgi:hypothetical protein